MDIRLKRAQEPAASDDGRRILVDRLWPRGISKQALRLDHWRKEVAPSTALRQWFHHEPEKWEEFQRRYFAELDQQPQAVEDLRKLLRQGRVTLVFSARDQQHNNAVALRRYLTERKSTSR